MGRLNALQLLTAQTNECTLAATKQGAGGHDTPPTSACCQLAAVHLVMVRQRRDCSQVLT